MTTDEGRRQSAGEIEERLRERLLDYGLTLDEAVELVDLARELGQAMRSDDASSRAS